jgi:flagellin
MSYATTNASSLSALRNLNSTNSKLSKTLESLSSGYKINHASDGAASLMISENLRSQVRGFNVAEQNVQQGVSMLQTADGALQSINEHLQRIREIAVAASNGTTTTDQFTAYTNDLVAEKAAIDSIVSSTKFGSNVLLDGSVTAMTIQAGPNGTDTIDIKAAFTSASDSAGLGLTTASIANSATGGTLLTEVDASIATLSGRLSTVGQLESSLSNQMDYIGVARENFTAAESSIRDTDIAQATAQLSRLQVLQQTATYALQTANSSSALMLRLLQ